MYTIESHSDVVDKEKRRRIVDVTFTNGKDTFVQSFSFSVDTELEVIKKTIKQFLDELNFVPPALTDLTLTTPPEPAEPAEPTRAELDRQAWEANWNKLQTVDKLIAAGILTGNETQVVALRNKVKSGFQVEYLE